MLSGFRYLLLCFHSVPLPFIDSLCNVYLFTKVFSEPEPEPVVEEEPAAEEPPAEEEPVAEEPTAEEAAPEAELVDVS